MIISYDDFNYHSYSLNELQGMKTLNFEEIVSNKLKYLINYNKFLLGMTFVNFMSKINKQKKITS